MASRDMRAAVHKVFVEGRCRGCGRSDRKLDAAHVIPRSRISARMGAEDPRNIIPLCRSCHNAHHGAKLELLPLLRPDEQQYIVGLVGLGEAYRRTTRRQ